MKIHRHLFLRAVAGCLTATLWMPNSAQALRPRGIDNAGLEQQLGVSLSGLEEDGVEFIYHQGDEEGLAGRQDFNKVGLGAWIPPLTPFEAAAVNAFVDGRPHHFPKINWQQPPGGMWKGNVDSFRIVLSRAEAAAFINRLYDLQTIFGAFQQDRMLNAARVRFRATALHGKGDNGEKNILEKRFWFNQFDSALKRVLAFRSYAHPFRLVGLERVGGRYYQPIPIYHHVEIPVSGIRDGFGIRLGDQTIRFEWVGKNWRLADSAGNSLFSSGPEEAVYLGGADTSVAHIRKVHVSVGVSSSVASVHAWVSRQNLRINGELRPFIKVKAFGNPSYETYIERNPLEMAKDQWPGIDQSLSSVAMLMHAGKWQVGLVRLLEMVEDMVLEKNRQMMFRREWGGALLRSAKRHLWSHDRRAMDPELREIIRDLAADLVDTPELREGTAAAHHEREEDLRIRMAVRIEHFREQHDGESPSRVLRRRWGLSLLSGLEEVRPQRIDLNEREIDLGV